MPPTTPSTPSKLMKRKSFGFVQLKPRNKPINDLNNVQANPSPSPRSPTSHPPHLPPRNPARPNTQRHSVSANPSSMATCSTSDLPSDLEAELHGNASASGSNASGSNCNASLNSSVDLNAGNRESVLRPSQSRHGSYGGLGLGRAPQGSSDNLDGSRRRSFSKSSRKRSKSRDKRTTTTPATITTIDTAPHTELSQDKEPGGRSFMGSVRRISFIGKQKQQERKEHRHKRTKSGVSLASVGDGIRKSFERTRTSGIEGNTTDTGEGEPQYANLAPPIPPLLPPIELSPPSPPRLGDPSPSLASASAAAYSAQSTFNKSPSLTNPKPTKAVSPKAVSPLTASLGRSTGVPSSGMGGKNITSSTSMPATSTSTNVPRRNSLGDLKIPARISQAQVGLRRDLGMVKEFAGRVERELVFTAYFQMFLNLFLFVPHFFHNLLVEVQSILDAQHAQYAVQAQSQSRGVSPLSGTSSSLGGSSSSPSSPSALNVMNPMNIFRPLSRIRSNISSTIISPSSSTDSTSAADTPHVSPTSLTGSSTHPEKPESTFPHPHSEVSPVSLQSSFPHPDTYKHLAAAFYTINSRYKIAWECAELLIELGGGPASAMEEGTGSSPGVINESVHPSSVSGNVFHGRPPTSTSAPTALGSVGSSQAKKSRERAITLSGDESSSSKPGTPTPDAGLPNYFSPLSGPTSGSTSMAANTSTFNSAPASMPNMAWRASTGRHDLNQRQLLLLREMLNNPDSTFVSESVPPGQQPLQPPPSSHRTQFDESMNSPMLTTPSALPTATDEVNREWRWGEGMNSSTITLPSEESSVPSGFGLDRLGAGGISSNPDDPHGNKKNRKTSRSSRLRGMSGLRDMLRSLTRNQNHQSNLMNASTMVPPSTTSLGTEESSIEYHHRYVHAKVPGAGAGESSAYTTQGRRRAKTSSGPDAGSSIRDRDQERSTSPYPNTHIRPISPFTASSLSVKASPRRPSLASIFRLGSRESKEGREGRDKKEKLFSSPSSPDVPGGVDDVMHTKERSGKTSGTSDEDWDRLELEYPQRRRLEKKGNNTDPSSDTIRGRSPYMQQDVALPPVPPIPSSASQTSLPTVSPGPSGVPGVPARATRLSNVEENEHPELALDDPSASMNSLSNRGSSPVPYRKNLKKNLTGSVRSMPAQPLSVDHLAHSNYHSRHSYVPHSAQTSLNDNNVAKQMKLAMTPENIKPLLENAKEVHARLTDCIGEIKGLVFALGEEGLGIKD
ncbi:hypothetical protein DFH05DRAFT_1467183 [Lentinula detonsa]|uniref:Uncharacterized protein n=1 Tax=Lentinula detonsa TaxID=2804962 RepID=A0A9W8PAQ1_9AGAR|nr:hypothetical protein DFH05DRAFT_1467183 [Lentinula detonsa]